MSRNRSLARNAAALVLIFGNFNLVACTRPTVTDRTPFSAPFVPDFVNEQEFTADIQPARGSEIFAVSVEAEPATVPMRRVGGQRYVASIPIPACDQAVSYRYLVSYDDEGDRPPFKTYVYPEDDRWLTRRIVDTPETCRDRLPPLGDRAFIVDTVEDEPDAFTGDGICSTFDIPNDPQARCSLRAAIMEANAREGTDVILLRGGRYVLTQTGGEQKNEPGERIGDLDITDSLVIRFFEEGVGCADKITDFLDGETLSDMPNSQRSSGIARIDAGGIDRVFDIYSGNREGDQPTTVQLECLHITGGSLEGRGDETESGLEGDKFGAGILNRGRLFTDRVAVTDNAGAGRVFGVGIANFGDLVMRDTALTQNRGAIEGAVFGGTSGGGLYNQGYAKIDQSLIAFNSGARGPGIANGYVSATGDDRLESLAELDMINTTVFGNETNDAAGNSSSALWNAAVANIGYSTIMALERAFGSGGSDAKAILQASILVRDGPSGRVCSGGRSIDASIGNTFRRENTCRPIASSGAVEALNEEFGSSFPVDNGLSDRGGFTPVLAIRDRREDDDARRSPIDSGFALRLCPSTDQRGFPRPVGERCDAGAFEFGASPGS